MIYIHMSEERDGVTSPPVVFRTTRDIEVYKKAKEAERSIDEWFKNRSHDG